MGIIILNYYYQLKFVSDFLSLYFCIWITVCLQIHMGVQTDKYM